MTSIENEMDTHAELAERLAQSDLISPKTARALVMAIQSAGSGRVQPEQFITASKAHKAKVRVVAAGCGWARCWHCGQWRDIGEELPDDPATCPCTLELEDDEVFHAFALYVYSGGPVCASLVVPNTVTERIERFRQLTGGVPSALPESRPVGEA